MTEPTTLKLRLPPANYLALMKIAHDLGQSVNRVANDFIEAGLAEYCKSVKEHRGQGGGNNESLDDET